MVGTIAIVIARPVENWTIQNPIFKSPDFEWLISNCQNSDPHRIDYKPAHCPIKICHLGHLSYLRSPLYLDYISFISLIFQRISMLSENLIPQMYFLYTRNMNNSHALNALMNQISNFIWILNNCCSVIRWSSKYWTLFLYSGDLKSDLVRILKCPKEVGLQT